MSPWSAPPLPRNHHPYPLATLRRPSTSRKSSSCCSQENIDWPQTSLAEMGGAWDITRYSKVQHGFTVWKPAGSRYHTRADRRSWAAMKMSSATRRPLSRRPHSSTPRPPFMRLYTRTYKLLKYVRQCLTFAHPKINEYTVNMIESFT